jgi:RimJ/RimL family protein N-acetyltransferase
VIITDERAARFVSDTLGFGLCAPWTCMGIERNGEVVAGVVFNNFEGRSVHMSAAGAGWTRVFLEAIGQYAFEQLGCARITAITGQPDVAALAKRLGGEVEGRLRSHFGPGCDGIVVGFLRDDWRYGSRNEQRRG